MLATGKRGGNGPPGPTATGSIHPPDPPPPEPIVTAERLVEILRPSPHPEEGGHFRDLTSETYSAMHRLPGDEIFQGSRLVAGR